MTLRHGADVGFMRKSFNKFEPSCLCVKKPDCIGLMTVQNNISLCHVHQFQLMFLRPTLQRSFVLHLCGTVFREKSVHREHLLTQHTVSLPSNSFYCTFGILLCALCFRYWTISTLTAMVLSRKAFREERDRNETFFFFFQSDTMRERERLYI